MPTAPSALPWSVHSTVVLGIITSLGLVAVSALLNFRMGYRSADTDLDGLVYGLGAGLGDALKAICPFMVAYGVKNRDYLATIAATAVFVVFTGYSFTAAIGFAAEHRNAKAAEATTAIDNRADTRDAQKRVKAKLDQLGPQRSSDEVKADINAKLKEQTGPRNRSVDEISQSCSLNRAATRETCGTIAILKTEQARAEESEALTTKLQQLADDLKQGGGAGAKASADPQVDALKRLGQLARATLSDNDVGFLLAILLALFIELGSGLGLYIATTPWRGRGGTAQPPGQQELQPTSIGAIDVFVLDRLEPDTAGEVRMTEIYASYLAWCRQRRTKPHAKSEFKRQFTDIAREVGMRNLRRGGQDLYQQVRLMKYMT